MLLLLMLLPSTVSGVITTHHYHHEINGVNPFMLWSIFFPQIFCTLVNGYFLAQLPIISMSSRICGNCFQIISPFGFHSTPLKKKLISNIFHIQTFSQKRYLPFNFQCIQTGSNPKNWNKKN